MNKKNILIVVLFVLFLWSSFAADDYVKPNESQVVVIARISIETPVYGDFFTKYLEITSRQNPKRHSIEKYGHPSVGLFVPGSRSTFSGFSRIADDQFIALLAHIPGDRILEFPLARLYPGGEDAYGIFANLPMNVQTVVPPKTRFVYIGSFSYRLKGLHFEVTSVTKKDEFDQAAVFVKEKYGNDAELVRVPISEME